jgi:hypothetical protein
MRGGILVVAAAAVVATGCTHGTPGAAATVTQSPASTAPSPTGNVSALSTVDWAKVTYPFDCGKVGYFVERSRLADLNGDGYLDAVVLVRCDAGAGSPPSGLYAFDGTSSPRQPRLLATLMSPNDDRLAADFSIEDTTVVMVAHGYSSARVARCCPDETLQLRWTWHGSSYSSTIRTG